MKALNTVNPFSIACVTFTGNFIGSLISLYSSDAHGRRPILCVSLALQVLAFLILGGLGCGTYTQAQSAGIVAMIIVFAFSSQGLFSPTLWPVMGELPEQSELLGCWVVDWADGQS